MVKPGDEAMQKVAIAIGVALALGGVWWALADDEPAYDDPDALVEDDDPDDASPRRRGRRKGRGGKVAALEGRVSTLEAEVQQLKRQIAIINSMTPAERRFPKTINGSRRKRIAAGSGLQVQDVNRLLKQFTQMEKMMKKMARGGMKKMLRGMPGGGMPPGMR